MMSKIPCGDTVTFKNALDLLREKYSKYIKGNVKGNYFNGNPRDLGGCCCHRPGEMMSTQGCEKRGGEVKRSHSEILSHYLDEKKESRNPLHILAAVARDARFHLTLSNPLKKLSTIPPKEGAFVDDALEELRYLSDYVPPKTLPAGSKKKQEVNNLRGTWLYSAVLVNGNEVSPDDVLGKKSCSFQWQFPTSSRLLTSVSMMKKEEVIDMSGGASQLQPKKQNKDVSSLNASLRKLTHKDCCSLKGRLTKKRIENTPDVQPGEGPVMYLFRRAHREPADDALNAVYDGKKDSKGKKKSADKAFEELVDESLALEKDAGEADEAPATDGEGKKKRSRKYKSQSIQIDGEGGALEAAIDDEQNKDGDQDEQNKDDGQETDGQETIRDRIRVKRELGDWITTNFNHVSQCISCDCERYNYWGYCQHCLYVEVLHLKKFPDGLAKEQWQVKQQKILHNLKTQCGKVLSNES